jgi:primosomal protein N''
MQAVFAQLNDNLQLIYRKAIDADAAIDQLQSQGKGKFTTIFDSKSGFETRAKRFAPYVSELAAEIEALRKDEQSQLAAKLPNLVRKIELMFTTLANFKGAIKT